MASTYPPGPGGRIQFSMPDNFGADPLVALAKWRDAYGDFVHFKLALANLYVLYDPELIQQVLVKDASLYHKTDRTKEALGAIMGDGLLISDGEFWRRQRRLAQPAFHTRRISQYADVMVGYTLDAVHAWQDGAWMNVDAEMMRLTLRVVAKTLFDADVGGDEYQTVAEHLTRLLHIADEYFSALIPLPDWLPTRRNRQRRQSVNALNEIIMGIIEERRARAGDRGDLLSMLMAATGEGGEGMTDGQLRDEVMTLYLAGHETTANALTWTWMLLAQHPAVREKLHAELDEVLGGRPPRYDDLDDLPYTERVVQEAIRLYPPAWMIARQPVQPTTVGGYEVDAGSVILIPIHSVHRHPRYWDDPDAFRPERFAPANAGDIDKWAYIPFGGGPRVCIGNSFAMMEARLVLATIAQRYTLELDPGQVIETEPLITLRPRHGMRMQARAREPVPAEG